MLRSGYFLRLIRVARDLFKLWRRLVIRRERKKI
jgi:hypothetical protein